MWVRWLSEIVASLVRAFSQFKKFNLLFSKLSLLTLTLSSLILNWKNSLIRRIWSSWYVWPCLAYPDSTWLLVNFSFSFSRKDDDKRSIDFDLPNLRKLIKTLLVDVNSELGKFFHSKVKNLVWRKCWWGFYFRFDCIPENRN